MAATFKTQYGMPSRFDMFRGSCRDAKNAQNMLSRHAVIACLFIIFAVLAVVGLPVIVAGLVVLLVSLLRLLLRSQITTPGT